jgi:hypothetical protein
MTRFRRFVYGCLLAAAVAAVSANAASATTFYVNERGGTDTNACTALAAPCETINGAIKRAEAKPGADTIEVSSEQGKAGVFKEAIVLSGTADKSLTINGEEPGVIIRNTGTAAVTVNATAGAVTLSNLKVEDQTGEHAVIADHGAALTLINVEVENQSESESGTNGIEASAGGSVTVTGGSVAMDRGTKGSAILADETPLTLTGATVISQEESAASGITSKLSQLSLTKSSVRVVEPETISKNHPALSAEKDTLVSLTGDTVVGESPLAAGVQLTESQTSANGLIVEMRNGKDFGAGVEVRRGAATLEHIEVSGAWEGVALLGVESSLTLSDSHLTANPANTLPAAEYFGAIEGVSLLIERSVLKAAADAEPGTLRVDDGNATIDSSEILGGLNGIDFVDGSSTPLTVTLAASTVDAGAPGVSPGVHGVEMAPAGALASANTIVEGSIVLEPDASKPTAGGVSNVVCSYSAVAVPGVTGCESGKLGNTNATAEASSLFAEPFTSYKLSPSSSAINSVPSSAITLPFGLTPSSTDLEGNPRSEGVNCKPLQDKGALELPGHGAVCPSTPPTTATTTPLPTPTPTKPLVSILTGLTISPSTFLPALSGGPLSATPTGKNKKYGAKVSYRDGQAATTTFTVLRKSSGRMHGKSCQKPSKQNKHGKSCTLLRKVGSFTHADKAGANSVHFSGRLNGKKLPVGSYELQLVARDAAGNGPAVEKGFKIK